eukprot:gnl/TRDRNA2_/TRDRNA2_177478_c1_seq1.p1 gnl/TRDRNA2_/TRDRNA2_177478_c1~~gnl/TRDRNA2_/TRDRNA2_177478_c1_seq1.p1  ORF type:complete len:794 (+),score=119.13 gnl/TRDRNA2_/TRDRNA2_177478_c1_seq1:35-2416(+)
MQCWRLPAIICLAAFDCTLAANLRFHREHADLWLAAASADVASTAGRRSTKSQELMTPGELIAEAEKDMKTFVEAVPETPARTRRELRWMLNAFLPGWKANWRGFYSGALIVTIACLWFASYILLLYETDRKEGLERWQAHLDAFDEQEGKQEAQKPLSLRKDGVLDIHPDLVFIFHHPEEAYKYPDRDKEVPLEAVESCFPHGNARSFHRTEELLRPNPKASPAAEKISDDSSSVLGETREEEEMQYAAPTYHDIRCAVMQDLCDGLVRCGFHVQAFSSIDGDEVFMCATLSCESSIDSYLVKHKTQLQIKPEFVVELGIKQPPEHASSPPFLHYDLRLVEKLHQEGILAERDPRELYKIHGSGQKSSIICQVDRIRVMLDEISQHFGLDAAVHAGLMKEWFAAHDMHGLRELKSSWANLALLRDLTFVQPVSAIHDYFGERIAFTCAWVGTYTKCLLALMPVSLFVLLSVYVARTFLHISWHSWHIASFGIVIVIWSRIAYNLWCREQSFYMQSWHMHSDEQLQRPEFMGKFEPSAVDKNKLRKQYPAYKTSMRHCLTNFVTVVFITLVAACVIIWVDTFNGKMNTVASVCLTIQIKIWEAVWNMLTPTLVDFENHEFQSQYYNSYLWKQVLFQSINFYSAFFYLMLKQDAVSTTEEKFYELQSQISMTTLCLALCLLAEMAVHAVMVNFKLWYEAHNLKQQGKDVPDMSFVEEQGKYQQIRAREQIQSLLQPVSQSWHRSDLWSSSTDRNPVVPLCLCHLPSGSSLSPRQLCAAHCATQVSWYRTLAASR